ncbi:LysR substrate-binding domain-containing protein [Paraburkholderia phenazinium]|jgi:DNA-binding transcriptional LysR family regulator|uniref:DNA-binding transcriptional regulator, LysR family n=1 Tax=Paraburkholderia phenazinium TaxID=60549 RepID=A0A1N6KS80_9BURK|nr:LysR substrate-binding domain-containing protein [Paraburkholderia phenazinium]SIO59380.1 DNA-binding transcriptional regulator, LysR family [Paraburkholderia phenazinium]
MDIEFLANLLLVVDSGSMAEAARRVGVTAAAVAQQVQALERELGVPLLVRAGRTVIPTEAGHRVIERARGLVREFSDLKAFALKGEAAGELRIGTITTALLSLMPDVLARFAAVFSQVKVLIRAGTSMELYETLLRGELDVAVCLHPAFTLPKAYDWHLLREEPLVVLAPARFAADDPHELLRREPFIRYDRSLGGGKQADAYLRAARIAPRELFELNSLMAIAMMVDRGLGVSLVPDIVSPLTAGLEVAKLTLPVKTEPRRFGVVWHRGSPRAHLIRGLLQCADEALVQSDR